MPFCLKSLFSGSSFKGAAFFVLVGILLSAPAWAEDTLEESLQELSQRSQLNSDQVTTAVRSAGEEIIKTFNMNAAEEQRNQVEADPDSTLQYTLYSVPLGLAQGDMAAREALENRQRELNLVSPVDAQGKKPDYLIDPSIQDQYDVDSQIFDIFMRYFCDPRGRGGTLDELNKKGGGISSTRYPNMKLGCGSVRLENGAIAASIPSRDGNAQLGEEPATLPTDEASLLKEAKRNQIKNLSLRPDELFMASTTFPVTPSGRNLDGHDNPLAPVYAGAFAQALHFLIGPPPSLNDLGKIDTIEGRAGYVQRQATIARQMLASYPFALLFSERIGSMANGAPQAVAEMLTEKLGPALAGDKNPLYARIENLKKRKNISIAEYDDIVMYQLLKSPGYMAQINQWTPAQLQREKARLMAMQTTLNYKRNQWMKILLAFEAVK